MKRIFIVVLWVSLSLSNICVAPAVSAAQQPTPVPQQPQKPPIAPQEPKKEEPKPSHQETDLSTILMHSTFMLLGRKGKEITYGTGFIIGRPIKKTPGRSRYVLVTAAHVLENIEGEKATIILRKKREDGLYEKVPFEFSIRNADQKPLWVRHADKDIDVAAMYIGLPADQKFPYISLSLIGEDTDLETYEIHPGDQLFCLGFPLASESPIGGFPILRSGNIASYPLTPSKKVRHFYFDFQVFSGNSGGPVYFVQTNRTYKGSVHVGETIRFVVGLVSAQRISLVHNNQPLYLATIIPSQFIMETINLLPEIDS